MSSRSIAAVSIGKSKGKEGIVFARTEGTKGIIFTKPELRFEGSAWESFKVAVQCGCGPVSLLRLVRHSL